MRSLGYGIWVLGGHWVETDHGDGNARDSTEDSFFVSSPRHSENFAGNIGRLGNQYDQQVTIIKGSDNRIKLRLTGGHVEDLGKVSIEKIGQAYSRLRKDGAFVFECASTLRAYGGFIGATARGVIERDPERCL